MLRLMGKGNPVLFNDYGDYEKLTATSYNYQQLEEIINNIKLKNVTKWFVKYSNFDPQIPMTKDTLKYLLNESKKLLNYPHEDNKLFSVEQLCKLKTLEPESIKHFPYIFKVWSFEKDPYNPKNQGLTYRPNFDEYNTSNDNNIICDSWLKLLPLDLRCEIFEYVGLDGIKFELE
jgi:hypothetical protein